MSERIRSWQDGVRKPASGVLVFLLRAWMKTLDYRVLYHDFTVDPIFPECQGPNLYIFWHEYILFPLYLREDCYLTMLLSQHRDADILSEVATRMGFEFVRGSTKRNGERAIRAMFAAGRCRHLTITPDGPRGPRRQMAPGAVYLASRLNMPIVAIGFGYDRPWRLQSWDRFAIPRPFSRARAVVSKPMIVPADLSRDGIEEYRVRIQDLLNELTVHAEEWAASGCTLPGEQKMIKASAAHPPGGFSSPIPPEGLPDADKASLFTATNGKPRLRHRLAS
ncbi:MAG: lysophospholipid acyltransferase family protein [Thermogutta sp.]